MAVACAPGEREYSSLDMSSHAFWARSFADRDQTFAQLRTQHGLTWHQPLSSLFPLEESGFLAVTRREDIVFVSQHPELFTSAQGRHLARAVVDGVFERGDVAAQVDGHDPIPEVEVDVDDVAVNRSSDRSTDGRADLSFSDGCIERILGIGHCIGCIRDTTLPRLIIRVGGGQALFALSHWLGSLARRCCSPPRHTYSPAVSNPTRIRGLRLQLNLLLIINAGRRG